LIPLASTVFSSTTKLPFGNTTVKNSTNNTLKILSLLGVKNVKVVQGNEFPIIKTNSFSVSEDIHGYNGLGCDLPETDLQPVNSNWIHFMYNTIKNNNKTILVATGPLTNIALLFTIYPDISQSIDKIVLMGGSIGIGNITPSAEANIYHDPEAGKIVFNSGINIVIEFSLLFFNINPTIISFFKEFIS